MSALSPGTLGGDRRILVLSYLWAGDYRACIGLRAARGEGAGLCKMRIKARRSGQAGAEKLVAFPGKSP